MACASQRADDSPKPDATEQQIAAISGHTSLAEVARYTKAANQEQLARQAMQRMERERQLSNLPTRLDKKAKKQ
jgi:hypothetical protein